MSIVIPSYNDLPFLRECLASIRDTCDGFDYEVLIVDDFVQPENSERLLELEDDRTRVILKEQRLGFAGNVNVGMRQANHDIVLLNSDVVAKPGWLDALQAAAYGDDRIGMVSPKLVYPDGRIQYGGTYYARVLAPQWFGHFHVGAPATKPSANVAGWNRSISGACVYIKKPVYDELGGLDEEFWLGFEDVDYGLRAWRSGVRCYYEPRAMLVHHESATRGYSQGARELASMRYFWRRWESLFLDRRLESRPEIDYVVSSDTDPLWQAYVGSQADALRDSGYVVRVHESSSSGVDEDLLSVLAGLRSVKIACDWRVAQTVWLASLEHGKPLYLLPGMETVEHGGDPALQARIVAGYRPEFDYVAPNRWTADQLRAEAAWEVAHRVVPALPRPGGSARGAAAESDPATDSDAVTLCIGDDEAWCRLVDDAVERRGGAVEHWRADEAHRDLVARLDLLAPGVVVHGRHTEHPLAELAIMATGAALVTRENDRLRYEILDGYNALTVPAGDDARLRAALESVLDDDTVRAELAGNGVQTAERISAANSAAMARVIEACASTPI